ncbi:MAG: dihydropteroate synthase [Ignavibacteria bacterium]|nr:dihydropteroate synthase [Ignavibacteria bacterium]
MIYKFGNYKYDFGKRTYIMGVLNITPDSFYNGGNFFKGKIFKNKILYHIKKMIHDGADFIDVGGESARPGSKRISAEQELERVLPVIHIIKKHSQIPVSIDTYKSAVAEEALKEGAVIVNDISGLRYDDKIPEVISRHSASCIIMHIKGTPETMQKKPAYKNLLKEIFLYLKTSVDTAINAGIRQIIIDPGIGFGKNLKHNLTIIKNLSYFKKLNLPILIGTSNKSFIDKVNPTHIKERIPGTLSANTIAILNGANILRVHNVSENKRAALLADAIKFL